MKREHKYCVFSLTDLQALNQNERELLDCFLAKMRNHRIHNRNKPLISAVVVDKNSVGEQVYNDTYALLETAIKAKQCREHGHIWNGASEALFCERCGYCNY